MRRALGVGLAMALAARSTTVAADPSAPQISPGHLHREDAQRLEDQQRRSHGDGAPLAGAAATPPDLATTTVVINHTMVGAGGVLLGVAALSAVTLLPLAALDSPTSGDSQGAYDTAFKVVIVAGVISGVTGFVLLLSSRSTVRVVPAVTPGSVGLAITGRI